MFSLTDLVAILIDGSVDNSIRLKQRLSVGHLEGNNEIVVAQQDVEVFALFRHVVKNMEDGRSYPLGTSKIYDGRVTVGGFGLKPWVSFETICEAGGHGNLWFRDVT